MKKIICLILSVILLCGYAFAANGELKFADGSCRYEGKTITLSDKVYLNDDKIYASIEDVLPKLGFIIQWDSSLGAYNCMKNGEVSFVFPLRNNIWVGPTEHIFETKPVIMGTKIYISEDVVSALCGAAVLREGSFEPLPTIKLVGEEKYCFINGERTELASNAYIYCGEVYIPIHETLPKFGFYLDWDFNVSAYTCTKNGEVSFVFPTRNNIWIGPNEYIFKNKPIVKDGQTLIPAEMFKTLCGCLVATEGEIPHFRGRDSINSSTRTDAYRLAGNSVVTGGGVTVIDGFGMELPSLSQSNAKAYASVINSVAASLPENINVYNIIVPTAAEYYAPLRYYPNQLSGIQMAYGYLSDRVTPVNVYDILKEKAGEKTYFKTDHHWTQRGAYYAYTEFMQYFDTAVDGIETFENYPTYNHVGSFAGFAKGTAAGNIMNNSPEMLERFIPKYGNSGQVYYDQYLSRAGAKVSAVNTYTNAYHNFIGGDNPITIFNTTAPSDRVLVIIKESYGNAFATWTLNNFKKVCVIDPRKFNGFNGSGNTLNLNQLCQRIGATDVLFINYPIAAASSPIRSAILKMK